MSDGFGHEVPPRHAQQAHRGVARYLVIIGSADGAVARLFLADRTPAGEFDAGTEEITHMTGGAQASTGADGPEWDGALAGHTATERSAATVYLLDV